MAVFIYIAATAFIFTGLICIRGALKKQTQQEKLLNKGNIKLTGTGGRVHMFGTGVIFIILALYMLFWKLK